MKKLFVFGCSHATGDFNLSEGDASWPEILASATGYDLFNNARSANSNDGILFDMLSKNFGSNDLIIVLMTFPHRMMISETQTVAPASPNDAWWFRHAHDDWFYRSNFIRNYLAIRHLLLNSNHFISFVDPTELFKFSGYKNLLCNEVKFLPKLTLSKSFPTGEDGQHLSPMGHKKMAEFWIEAVKSHERIHAH